MLSFAKLAAVAALPAVMVSASPLMQQQEQVEKRAHLALPFKAPSSSPTTQSINLGGLVNQTLTKQPVVAGKAFDRLVHIWLENTDADTAMATEAFQKFAKEGITLSNRYALTHPSEPEYISEMAGDFFGLSDDSFWHVPEYVTTLFDLLDAKSVSYSCYQESMPANGYTGFNYTQTNYLVDNAPNYTYYVRKHDPCAIADYVSGNATRAVQSNRNSNAFAADLAADALPQWMFYTPNMVDDGHDTTPAFLSNWTDWFLTPLLNDTRFNDNRTLIVLTFDENEDYTAPNRIAAILLGGVIPEESKGTTDSRYYTHYSDVRMAEVNWDLQNLGRGDMNKSLANVYDVVANKINYTNLDVDPSMYHTNETGIYPGAFSLTQFANFTYPPNADDNTLIKSGINKTNTEAVAFANTRNLTAEGVASPFGSNPFPLYPALSNSSSTASKTSFNGAEAGALAGKSIVAIGAVALLSAGGLLL